MADQTSTPHKPLNFYRENYVYLPTPVYLSPDMPAIVLEDQISRQCRFCDQMEPATSFSNEAHAIPVSLGNKCLFSTYECNTCNQYFGDTIENDLGNWSIVNRTLSGICGKKKAPTLKSSGPETSWRITNTASGLRYKEYEDCSIISIDEENKELRFQLQGASYTPIAVFKAFAKIGLTLLPREEVNNFSELVSWVRDPDHSNGFVKHCSIISTFIPGPMPCNIIVPRLLRRKPRSCDLPYIFLVLGYGNDLIQMWLPSREKDGCIWGTTLEMPPFPPIINLNSAIYGKPSFRVVDLSERKKVREKTKSHTFRFESMEEID